MRIQSIGFNTFRSSNNTKENHAKRKREGWDRSATIQDLHEAEDRIIAHQEKIMKLQNKKLSILMKNIIAHQQKKEVQG